jgi:hypothetical protein
MEGALFKKVVMTALFCRPNKRSPDEPSETEGVPLTFFLGTIFVGTVEDDRKYLVQNKNRSELYN